MIEIVVIVTFLLGISLGIIFILCLSDLNKRVRKLEGRDE